MKSSTMKRETKTVRVEQRIRPSVKARIAQAASLLGVDESTFISSAAYREAEEVISSHQRTVLSPEDTARILAALDNPPEPTPALKAAFRKYAKAKRAKL